MNPLYEDLSRLLQGDLQGAEAEQLRVRIAQEPEVAEAWRHLRETVGALEALPSLSPPPALDEQILQPRRSLPRPRRFAGWVPLLAVAAAALLVLWPRSQPTLLLVSGDQWIEGHTTVRAGDHLLEVDGRALVSVEPAAGSLRVTPQEDSMSTTTHIAAAVTGALVTVAVYEGVVHVRSDTEPTVHVQAGETRQLGEPRTVLREVPAAAPGPVVASSSTPTDEPSLAPEQRIAALEAQVAELSFERDLLQGQLAFVNGEPQAWPSDVPDAFQPEAFEERLAAELKQRGIGQIAVLDCNEYPCIAIVDVTPGTDPMALHASIGEIGDHFEADGRDASVMALVSKRETPDGESTMLALAITPDGDDVGDQRTKVRTEALLAEMEDATTDP